MDMEKSASRFKFFDTARNFGCIFFVKMENWHIGRDKENLVFTKKGRKIMRKIKRKKGYAGKMQDKIFGQIRMNEIIEKKKKSDIKLQSLMSKAEKMDKIIVDKERVELEINRLDLANKQLQYLPILDKGVYVEHQEDSIFSMVFNVTNAGENSYDITVQSFIDIGKENNPTYYYDAFFTIYPNSSHPGTYPKIAIRDMDMPCSLMLNENGIGYRDFVPSDCNNLMNDTLDEFRMFLRTIGMLNYISKNPEIKQVEPLSQMKQEQTILHPENIKEDTEINYEQKAIILNGTKIVSLNEETIRHLACKPHQRLTESWTVRGHYRHYASGKVGFVKPYTKGTGKKTAKTYKLAETI